MFFYWRIQQDLNCMGEFLIFLDPSLSRCWRVWMRRNAAAIALAESPCPQPEYRSHLN